jgi:hypothetical protein
LKNLTAASISSSVLRETFEVNLWLIRCLKSSQFFLKYHFICNLYYYSQQIV